MRSTLSKVLTIATLLTTLLVSTHGPPSRAPGRGRRHEGRYRV